MRVSRPSQLPVPVLLLISLLLLLSHAAWAQSSAQTAASIPPAWNDAVARLASRIGSIAGSQGVISIVVRNASSLQEGDVAAISQALKSELERLRFSVTADSSAQTIATVTLSEGTEGYVWVAQVHNADSERLVFVPVQKPDAGGSNSVKPTVTLQRRVTYAQETRFTDFSVSDVTSDGVVRMLVLEPTRLYSYHLTSGRWEKAMMKILHPNMFPPRDPRGVISGVAHQFSVYLPGESCLSPASGDQGDLNCASEVPTTPDMEWPIEGGGTQTGDATFQVNRNYFNGLVTMYGDVYTRLPAFFTAAALSTQDDEHWILAELDGKARLYDASAKPSATFSGWGDDIATVVTGCAGQWQVLATGIGDWTQLDHIQTYEIRDRQAIAVGQPLDFPGPILSLWPSNDMRSARVVSRNLQTGMYEASIVSVTCSE